MLSQSVIALCGRRRIAILPSVVRNNSYKFHQKKYKIYVWDIWDCTIRSFWFVLNCMVAASGAESVSVSVFPKKLPIWISWRSMCKYSKIFHKQGIQMVKKVIAPFLVDKLVHYLSFPVKLQSKLAREENDHSKKPIMSTMLRTTILFSVFSYCWCGIIWAAAHYSHWICCCNYYSIISFPILL